MIVGKHEIWASKPTMLIVKGINKTPWNIGTGNHQHWKLQQSPSNCAKILFSSPRSEININPASHATFWSLKPVTITWFSAFCPQNCDFLDKTTQSTLGPHFPLGPQWLKMALLLAEISHSWYIISNILSSSCCSKTSSKMIFTFLVKNCIISDTRWRSLVGKPKFLLTTRARLRSKVQPSRRRISLGFFFNSDLEILSLGGSPGTWQKIALQFLLSPFYACKSAAVPSRNTRDAQRSNTFVLIAINPEFSIIKKKDWEVPNLLLLRVLADFFPQIAPWSFYFLYYWCLGELPPLHLPAESLSKWFLAWIMQEKMWDFWLFALLPALLMRKNSSCTKNIQLASKLHLPSTQNGVGLQFCVLTGGWCATTLPVSSSRTPAC